MKKISVVVILAVAAIFSLLTTSSQAREVIKNFDVSIEIKEDGTMLVTERIAALVEHEEINRGIVRVFPVTYTNGKGRKVSVDFKVLSAEIDGKRTEVSVSTEGSYKEARIGNPYRTLSRGDHIFTITYETTRQLGFFREYDELYWNVTGNDWIFPILAASCSVKLPGRNPGEGFDTIEWYTGKYGQKGEKSDAMALPNGTVKTTRSLTKGEGLTVVYTWPKGIVAAPPTDNFAGQMSVAIVSLALILAWFIYARRKYDGTGDKAVIPLFYPPNDASPAFTRYIYTMDADNISFTAAIIGLAVKGALRIEEDGDEWQPSKTSDTLTLTKEPKTPDSLQPEEEALMDNLFKNGQNSLTLRNENASRLTAAATSLGQYLTGFQQTLVNVNLSRMLPCAAIYALGALTLCFFSLESLSSASTVIIAGCAIIVVSMSRARAPKLASGNTLFNAFFENLPALLMGVLAAVLIIADENEFLAYLIGALWLLYFNFGSLTFDALLAAIAGAAGALFLAFLPPAETLTLLPLTLFLSSAALIAFISPLIIIYTERGTELARGVEGLLLYMNVAEKDRLQMPGSPEETPQLFERLLPYALALGIEKTWGDRFEKVLQNAQYVPAWYTGPSPHIFTHRGGLPRFSSKIGGQVTSSMKPPKSSGTSGSWRGGGGGGGGFSGGGRGGGGGRGW